MYSAITSRTDFLDEGVFQLQQGQNITETMSMIFSELHQLRQDVPVEDWKQFATHACREHPLLGLIHQDPLSWRVFAKPRGYPGDAVMLDFIYAVEDGVTPPAVAASSELGRHIYAYTAHAEAAQAVRSRRRLINQQLNELAARKPGRMFYPWPADTCARHNTVQPCCKDSLADMSLLTRTPKALP